MNETETGKDTGTSQDMPNLDQKSGKEFFDSLTKIAVQQLGVSNKFKEPLLDKWKKYEDLKAGKVQKKLRSQFNVPLPVFSGMLDTLAADFDEPVEIEFKKKHPSDYFKAQKIQAAFNLEKTSTDKDAKWDYKSRIDKSLNIIHGRSFLKEFAFSDPKYHNVLEVADPLDMHTQPQGGGILENHLFTGQEGILRSIGDIEDGIKSGMYDKSQWKELREKSRNPDYVSEVTEHHREKMQRFQALGLNPDNSNFVGEETYNLCEWVLTYKGKRYYLLFDPWTMTWIRGEKLSDIFSLDLMPWSSWASHEDNKVFWSKSYADDIYPVADAVITLFNQELTNREKRNMNARAYDRDMFTNVAKLDEAQYRPDALVPVETKGGTRRISDGIYAFETPELQGTINLLDWVNTNVQKDTGITDISQGAAMQATKKVNVAYMEQAAVAKRIGFKSQSYTECWGEIGTRYVQGLKDHLSASMQIELLGDMGLEPDVLTHDDLELKADLGVRVISSTSRKEESQKRKQGRIKAMEMITSNPNIGPMEKATILRDVGEYDEDEIRLFLDVKSYASKESIAKAHLCIQELLTGKMPNLNYAADSIFLKTIFDYMMDHHNKLGVEKGKKFTEYLAKHAQIAQQNSQMSQPKPQGQGAQPGQPQPGQPGQQQPSPAMP